MYRTGRPRSYKTPEFRNQLLEEVNSRCRGRDRGLNVFDLETLLCCYRKDDKKLRQSAHLFLAKGSPNKFAADYEKCFRGGCA